MEQCNMKKLCENIDEVCKYDFDRKKGFGAAYAVCLDGAPLERCYGVSAPESGEPISNRTLFRLASMSKPVTAVAALTLVEDGLLSLDDGIDKYLPVFKEIKIIDLKGNTSVPKRLPTVRDLLTHTAGIGSIGEKIAKMTAADRESLDSAIAFYIRDGLDFAPGEAQIYSGTGAFDVLTKIIELVTGKDYLTFLKEKVLIPCEMVDTTFIPSEEQWGRMVEMHQRTDGENATDKMHPGCVFETVPMTHFLGGAGLVSTLHDYSNFAEMLLGEGTFRGKVILKKDTFRLLSTPQVSESIMPGTERWGLGVRVIVDEKYPYLPRGAFGWSGAYGSHFWIDPVHKLYAVFLKNSRVDGGAANESARMFEKAVYTAFS